MNISQLNIFLSDLDYYFSPLAGCIFCSLHLFDFASRRANWPYIYICRAFLALLPFCVLFGTVLQRRLLSFVPPRHWRSYIYL